MAIVIRRYQFKMKFKLANKREAIPPGPWLVVSDDSQPDADYEVVVGASRYKLPKKDLFKGVLDGIIEEGTLIT